jgi:hypothetical protein
MRWPTFSPASNGSVHIFVTASRAELAWIAHIPGSASISRALLAAYVDGD